ncbi:MAG: arylesterase [Thermodesulfobacteriota bacterium]|nr:arylesterase [Thermodesulfobacteriota bacterium]
MKKIVIFLCVGLTAFLAYRVLTPGPEIRNAHPSGQNIIAFGDSLTFGTGASGGMDYPSQLSGMISMPVINAGIPGDTTASALHRLKDDVLSQSPRIVLITLGGNDLKNGTPKGEAFKNLKLIVEAIQDEGALVVLAGVHIPFLGRGFKDAYEQLSQEAGTLLIANIFEGIMGNRSLMSDAIHPNDDGYAIVAERFYRVVKPYL